MMGGETVPVVVVDDGQEDGHEHVQADHDECDEKQTQPDHKRKRINLNLKDECGNTSSKINVLY